LRQGIGLIVVDVVTTRQANLHGELLARLTEGKASSAKLNLYAIARSSDRAQWTAKLGYLAGRTSDQQYSANSTPMVAW
jgi:pyrroloquinoline quinone (PQQ) biosynthesis protein C